MSKIINIGTAVPAYRHLQNNILQFMQEVYCADETDARKLKYLYAHSGINSRYSCIADYSLPKTARAFYPKETGPFPDVTERMALYQQHAAQLSVEAIRNCMKGRNVKDITHLITVSCTGMSAPGLDIQIVELLQLEPSVYRTSVNFMGCYAAVHALKQADAICKTDPDARVIIVCTELCTIHFQNNNHIDNITASMLFADGAAATLVTHNSVKEKGLRLEGYYSEIIPRGKNDMAWQIAASGFLMTLSNYIPVLIEEDFNVLIMRALEKNGYKKEDIGLWCIHPGGKRILEAVEKSVGVDKTALHCSYHVLRNYGNMSSATILFVMKELLQKASDNQLLLGAAFGPGLTMETFTARVTES